MIMSDTVSTFDRFADTSVRRQAFTAELETVPDALRGSFIRNYADAEHRYIVGTLDVVTFSGIVGELVRDVRGTAAAVETAKRRAAVESAGLPGWMAGHVTADDRTRGTLRLRRR